MRQNFNIYMSETSKHNPFGANSLSSTYQEKRIFKYNLMKEYIKLTTKDVLLKEYEQSKYLGSMLLGIAGGYFIAVALAAYYIYDLESSRRGKLQPKGSQLVGRYLCMPLLQVLDSVTDTLSHSRGTIRTYAIISWINIFLRRSRTASRITKSQNDLHIVLKIIIKRNIIIYIVR